MLAVKLHHVPQKFTTNRVVGHKNPQTRCWKGGKRVISWNEWWSFENRSSCTHHLETSAVSKWRRCTAQVLYRVELLNYTKHRANSLMGLVSVCNANVNVHASDQQYEPLLCHHTRADPTQNSEPTPALASNADAKIYLTDRFSTSWFDVWADDRDDFEINQATSQNWFITSESRSRWAPGVESLMFLTADSAACASASFAWSGRRMTL